MNQKKFMKIYWIFKKLQINNKKYQDKYKL